MILELCLYQVYNVDTSYKFSSEQIICFEECCFNEVSQILNKNKNILKLILVCSEF